MIKIVDITLIIDKVLDIYCLHEFKSIDNNTGPDFNNVTTKKIALKLFKDFFDELCSVYAEKYDKTYFIVPCFPIMRSNGLSSIHRFSCTNSEYLTENGVSQSQFQDLFEKFLKSICTDEYVSNPQHGIYVLNGRYATYDDWTNIITNEYGKMLIDTSIGSEFDANPGFFKRFDLTDSTKIKELDKLELFKMKSAFSESLKS